MSEEIQTHVVVLADYYVVADDVKGHQLHTISAKVLYCLLFCPSLIQLVDLELITRHLSFYLFYFMPKDALSFVNFIVGKF